MYTLKFVYRCIKKVSIVIQSVLQSSWIICSSWLDTVVKMGKTTGSVRTHGVSVLYASTETLLLCLLSYGVLFISIKYSTV